MTELRKAVGRGTLDSRFVVEITDAGVRMREKRRRTWFGPYPWGRLYIVLARMTADAAIVARKKARAAKRAAR